MNTYTKREHVQSNRSQNGYRTLRQGASKMRKRDKIHVLEARVYGKYKEGAYINILKLWNVSQCFVFFFKKKSRYPYPLFWSVVFRNCCYMMICCSYVCGQGVTAHTHNPPQLLSTGMGTLLSRFSSAVFNRIASRLPDTLPF